MTSQHHPTAVDETPNPVLEDRPGHPVGEENSPNGPTEGGGPEVAPQISEQNAPPVIPEVISPPASRVFEITQEVLLALVEDASMRAAARAVQQYARAHSSPAPQGLDFIESNAWATNTTNQLSPNGFNIIFPTMIDYAKEFDLTLPLSPNLVDSLRHIRDSKIRNRNLEYVAEGLGKSCNWKEIFTHQRSNGSLFNSPATTAAALIQCHDDKCFEYLNAVLEACNSWVPTIYPMDIHTRLCVVDTCERLGIDSYFGNELDIILDEIYSVWQDKEEEIFSDITSRAMAFRLLRMKGYDVSSDELAEFVDQEHFFHKVSIQYTGVTTVLELFRASRVRIYEDESILEKIHSWTSAFLKQQLLNRNILDKQLHKQVEYDLRNFHGTLNRVGNSLSIELYDDDNFQILKTAHRCPTVHNKDFFLFSVQDFGISQAQYQNELQEMERWYVECRLDLLHQGRNTLRICYVTAALAIPDPKLSMARLSAAQIYVLVTCVDDFFDHYGSKEESLSIIELVSEWNVQPDTTYCSQEVEILFTALYDTVNQIAANAYIEQGRCVQRVLVSMWLELLDSFWREKDCWSENKISTLDEYLSFAWKSIAGKLSVLTSSHFLGIKISKDIYTSMECASLCKHASIVCRLLNDLKSFKREQEEGVLNSVSIQTVKDGRAISEEEAISNVQQTIEYHRRKLRQMVLYQRKGSFVPRECKDLFWKTSMAAHWLYSDEGGDGFSSQQELVNDIKALVWESPELPPLSKSMI